MQIQVYETKPEDFKPSVEVAACHLEVDSRLLLLQSASSKREAGRWGVPAGKLEKNERPEEAARRELWEETGIAAEISRFRSLGSLYIRKPDLDYVYHLFQLDLVTKPEVRLSSEHLQYFWASDRDMEELPLMEGARDALKKYRAAVVQKRGAATVNVYLILRKKEGQVLWLYRQNTGYLDHHWSFPAGHVEPGEYATTAMIREAYEEIGAEIFPQDLNVVHVMHRKTNRMNVDIFFECREWRGEIQNREPEKCGGLEFFPIERLPSPVFDHNAFVLEAISRGQFYSEWGNI